YAPVSFKQNSAIPKELNCALTENGHIEVSSMQKTSVDGIFACGDNSSMFRSVAAAVYSGNIAGAIINNELTQEHF
ncbi:MAG: FAD-dependent oxidoreductase, partial [Bacteroidota bacterium]